MSQFNKFIEHFYNLTSKKRVASRALKSVAPKPKKS